MDLVITTNVDGPCPVVGVDGEVDIATAPQLREALDALIDAEHRQVVVDLAECPFVDSSGLGVVVAAAKRLEATGGWVALARPHARVARALELSGLDQLLPVHETLEAALAQCDA